MVNVLTTCFSLQSTTIVKIVSALISNCSEEIQLCEQHISMLMVSNHLLSLHASSNLRSNLLEVVSWKIIAGLPLVDL